MQLTDSTSPHALDPNSCLSELLPRVGNYMWAWPILKQRYRKHGCTGFPHRVYSILRRCGNRRKPYFIGEAAGGVRFLGDWRDPYSVFCAIEPSCEGSFAALMADSLRKTPGVYLDVGANMGRVAAMVAKAHPGQEVVAFEPVLETAKRAAATFALNGMCDCRIYVAAVTELDGDVCFFAAGDDTASASLYNYASTPYLSWSETRVRSFTLDSLADQGTIGKVGLIKLDVEGSELAAIRGARMLISRDAPTIIYEYHCDIAPKVGWTLEDIATEIGRVPGYSFQILGHNNTLEELPAPADVSVNIVCKNRRHSGNCGLA